MDDRVGPSRSRALLFAASAFLALTVLHDLDHMRQGRELPVALNAIGAFGTIGAVAIVVWTLRRANDTLRSVAGAFGITSALGLVVIHVVPRWSSISDPYGEAGVDLLSWTSLAAFIAGGVALALVAFRHRSPR